MESTSPHRDLSFRRVGYMRMRHAGVAPKPSVPLQFQASNLTLSFVPVYNMSETVKQAAVQAITKFPEGGKLRHQLGAASPSSQRGRRTKR